MPGNDPPVVIRDLSFRYPMTVSGRDATPLRHINLTIHAGEFIVITGPSGSGKSTLARCLNGLIPHATSGTMEGDVIVGGMNTREHCVADFAPFVGMVFQDPGYQLVTNDVESELAFGLEVQNLPEQEIRTRILTTAKGVQISHLLTREVGDLSWGERQRVAIASVLAVAPPILVMDEPFSGIDASTACNLACLLLGLKKTSGTTIIVFEHRTAVLLPVADRLIAMQNGAIVSDRGPCQDVTPDRECSAISAIPSLETGLPGNTPPPSAVPGSGSLLSMQDVVSRYPGKTGPVLQGISLAFYPGEVTIISGANGSGKTTLLKHCNGLLTPDYGSVTLGTELLRTTTVADAARNVGLLNQHADHQLFESTIVDELAFGPRNLGRSEDRIGEVIRRICLHCSLDHIDPSTPPLGLSGGEKQRVALASILAMETPVVVLDEPTFGLDPALKHSLVLLLRRMCDAGKTIIVATHDDEFAEACGDRFIRIAGGRVESDCRRSPRPRTHNDPAGTGVQNGGGDAGEP